MTIKSELDLLFLAATQELWPGAQGSRTLGMMDKVCGGMLSQPPGASTQVGSPGVEYRGPDATPHTEHLSKEDEGSPACTTPTS